MSARALCWLLPVVACVRDAAHASDSAGRCVEETAMDRLVVRPGPAQWATGAEPRLTCVGPQCGDAEVRELVVERAAALDGAWRATRGRIHPHRFTVEKDVRVRCEPCWEGGAVGKGGVRPDSCVVDYKLKLRPSDLKAVLHPFAARPSRAAHPDFAPNALWTYLLTVLGVAVVYATVARAAAAPNKRHVKGLPTPPGTPPAAGGLPPAAPSCGRTVSYRSGSAAPPSGDAVVPAAAAGAGLWLDSVLETPGREDGAAGAGGWFDDEDDDDGNGGRAAAE